MPAAHTLATLYWARVLACVCVSTCASAAVIRPISDGWKALGIASVHTHTQRHSYQSAAAAAAAAVALSAALGVLAVDYAPTSSSSSSLVEFFAKFMRVGLSMGPMSLYPLVSQLLLLLLLSLLLYFCRWSQAYNIIWLLTKLCWLAAWQRRFCLQPEVYAQFYVLLLCIWQIRTFCPAAHTQSARTGCHSERSSLLSSPGHPLSQTSDGRCAIYPLDTDTIVLRATEVNAIQYIILFIMAKCCNCEVPIVWQELNYWIINRAI